MGAALLSPTSRGCCTCLVARVRSAPTAGRPDRALAYWQKLRLLARCARLCPVTPALIGFTACGGICSVTLNRYPLRPGRGPRYIGPVNGMPWLSIALLSLPAAVGYRRFFVIAAGLCAVAGCFWGCTLGGRIVRWLGGWVVGWLGGWRSWLARGGCVAYRLAGDAPIGLKGSDPDRSTGAAHTRPRSLARSAASVRLCTPSLS